MSLLLMLANSKINVQFLVSLVSSSLDHSSRLGDLGHRVFICHQLKFLQGKTKDNFKLMNQLKHSKHPYSESQQAQSQAVISQLSKVLGSAHIAIVFQTLDGVCWHALAMRSIVI